MCLRARWLSVTRRDLERELRECDESECGLTLAAMPLASNTIAIAIRSARRSGQTNFTFTNPIPGHYPDKAA